MNPQIRKCWGCSREVAEPATLCEDCRPKSAEMLPPAGAGEPLVEESKSERAPAFSGRLRLSRRDWVLVLAGAAGATVLVLVLLMSRAIASPEAAVHPGSAATAPAVLSTVSAAPKWSSANRTRWVGNARESAAFDLVAENRVQVWTKYVQPTLVVRCVSGAVEVFVFTESAARLEPDTDEHTVHYAFDDEPSVTERWPDSIDHDGLFAPHAAAFADRLTRATTLRFGFTPHNAAPVDVHFSVTGLGDLLEPAAAGCGRAKRP